MLWIALAAQISVAQPIAPMFSNDDFPAYLQQAAASRNILIAVTVASDGRVSGCYPELSSGDPRLDQYTCILVMNRGRFAPARRSDGTPVTGVIRLPISWNISSTADNNWTHGDLDVTVNQLPKGVSSPHFESLAIDVEGSGKIVNCQGDARAKNPELTNVACETVIKAYTAPIAKDAKGAAVESVQNVLVRFTK